MNIELRCYYVPMLKKYSIKPKVSEDLIEQLLHNRGIKTPEEKEVFLNPDFEKHSLDPFLLPDMKKAVGRILQAIDKKERIGIWGDYDVDGVSSVALLYDFFKKISFDNFTYYIPSRQEEGYGLNKDGLDELSKEKVNLLVTVDCGIRDFKNIEYAKSLGMEVIITDHHEPSSSIDTAQEELPEAFAVIDPKRIDSKYPEKILCGAGVVWKLIQAILQTKRELLPGGQEKWFLDLVGLATLADMVPLTGENRMLALFGLKVMQRSRRPGFLKFFSMLKMNKENLNEDDVSFMIAPRLNAASRMGHPIDALNLLIADNEIDASTYAKHLSSINDDRKILVANIVKEAKKKIREKFDNGGEKPVIVIGNPDWYPSILGLVANSIVEEYERPVFLWGRGGGDEEGEERLLRGSCRSDGVTDLVAVMEKRREVFIEFGGHKMSGGFSVSFEKIHTLEEVLVESFLSLKKESKIDNENKILVDAELSLKNVSSKFVSDILKLAPFGMFNEKPIFIFRDVIPEKINRFGKAKEHLSINFRDGSQTLRAISFFASPDQFGDCLKEGIKTNLVANIEKSFYNGRSEIRLRIVDFF